MNDSLSFVFDSKNPRIHHALQKRALNNPPVIALSIVLFVLFLSGGIILLFFKLSIGWLLVGLSVLPLMLVFWIKNALATIPIGQTKNFTDLLSPDLLLSLKSDLAPAELVKIPAKTRSGAFLMARLISAEYKHTAIHRETKLLRPR